MDSILNSKHRILDNFKVYDELLSSFNGRQKKILTSLKMMYAVHMESVSADKNFFFIIKQLIRFFIKFLSIPFYVVVLRGLQKPNDCAIVKGGEIERYIAAKDNISLIFMEKKVSLNPKSVQIYKDLYHSLYILLNAKKINKLFVVALAHRLIDYLISYHTVEIGMMRGLFLENDRTPKNLALVHLAREKNIKTIKYDNWLISQTFYNDIYCEYYFYPSLYHKAIMKSYSHNEQCTFIEGGFLFWDRLSEYKKIESGGKKKIIYFTQFGIPLKEHTVYIEDIHDCMKKLNIECEIVIKIHPKEDVGDYQSLLKYGKVIGRHHDLYALIAESDYCFSIYSTVSLEAKHIINNSFFINYQADRFDLVDYNALKLDLVASREELCAAIKGEYTPISQEKFIRINNCSYPHTVEKLRESFCDD